MMAPLSEQGTDKIREVLEAGINYFQKLIPAKEGAEF